MSLPSRERGLKYGFSWCNGNTGMSLPSRERGLKSAYVSPFCICVHVAPLAGAWIEIEETERECLKDRVAPLAGAWIEISVASDSSKSDPVAPLAGAWIEIEHDVVCFYQIYCRSPRGSVD